MKDFNEHIDLIERYVYEDMKKEELEELNRKLREDREFNKLFHDMDNLDFSSIHCPYSYFPFSFQFCIVRIIQYI